jgi:hypothetical protein
MPTATDLVTDLPADFEVFGQAVATSMADLLGGTTGQVLAKASNTDMDFSWVAIDPLVILDAKGDLITATAADTPARLAVGANGTSLVADSTTATGLAYASRATLAGNTFTADQSVNGLVVGRSAGNVSSNTALGAGALGANTTGARNSSVGNFSMGANTTGSDNNAVGNDSLRFNTTASANNAFGSNALGANTTGDTNTAVGNYALGANTTGTVNTAVGGDALRFNTTGSSNTCVGLSAGNSGTTRNDNTGVGRGALYNSNGNSNTAIGYDAGSLTTSGTNNTSVGASAQPSSATVSNTITLGNSSIATLRCQVTSITSLSDERDKTDIAPLEHGLDFVKQLKPVSFEWNTRPETRTDFEGNEIEVQGKVGIADIGFIAQDIVALEDSLGAADSLQLSYRDNPEKLEVTQGRLIPILVKAIQDLTAKVEALEAAQA